DRGMPRPPAAHDEGVLLRLSHGSRLSVVPGEGGVEGGLRWFDGGEPPDETECLRGADEALHAGVLPFDADRAVVADRVEHAEDPFPGDVAVSGGDEVPAAARIAPGQVRAEPAVAPVEVPGRVLAVHVVDAVLEVVEEADRVEVLPHEVARIEVETERRPKADRVEGAGGGPVVVGDHWDAPRGRSARRPSR